jgi:NAD(P)-dependent dehydrogenase (short-subunit alcohol dehydrogenase family)
MGGTPGMGAHQSAKFAVEGFSEVLAGEVAPFGIRVVIIEPGAFLTDWQGSSMELHAVGADYEETVGLMNKYRAVSEARAVETRALAEVSGAADFPEAADNAVL